MMTQTRRSPFPGPAPYDADSALTFRGRDKDLDELAMKIGARYLVVLEAPSGVGKTSLIRAGLLPRLRSSRIQDAAKQLSEQQGGQDADVVDSDEPNWQLRPFPILIRQWGSGGSQPFISALSDQIKHSLDESLAWLDRVLAENEAAFNGGDLESDLGLRAIRLERAAVVDALNVLWEHGFDDPVELVAKLGRRLGPILIVLDQLEEVLESRHADAVLELVVRIHEELRGKVRQLLSYRVEYAYLLRPLEGRGLLSAKRFQPLDALTRQNAEDALAQVCADTRTPFDPHLLAWLVDSFSDSAGRVRLLGLQALLWQLWERCGGVLIKGLDQQVAEAYRAGRRLDSSVADASLRGWIDRKLTTSLLERSVGLGLGESMCRSLMSTLVSRVAEHLVVGVREGIEEESGARREAAKRPVSLPELKRAAYEREMADQMVRPSGAARIHRWTGSQVRVAYEALLLDALDALESGSVLKRYPTEPETWELVHDGFGWPLLQWSKQVKSNPKYWLDRLDAVNAMRLVFDTQVHGTPAERFRLEAVVWPSCLVEDTVFRDVVIHASDFERVLFRNCVFERVAFDGCSLRNAVFEGCRLDSTAWLSCDMQGAEFRATPDSPCTLNFCRLHDVDMQFGKFLGCDISDTFIGQSSAFDLRSEVGPRLDYMVIKPLTDDSGLVISRGSIRELWAAGGADSPSVDKFWMPPNKADPEGPSLRWVGGGIKSVEILGKVRFENVNMRAFGMERITDEHGRISFCRVDMTGSVFFEAILKGTEENAIDLVDCVLSGSVFLGGALSRCKMRVTAPGLGRAATMLIRPSADAVSTSRPQIGPLRLDGYNCDGLVLEGCVITGEIEFADCSLHRCGLFDLESDEAQVVDMSSSDHPFLEAPGLPNGSIQLELNQA